MKKRKDLEDSLFDCRYLTFDVCPKWHFVPDHCVFQGFRCHNSYCGDPVYRCTRFRSVLTINEMVGRYRNVGRIEETRCVKPDPTISREWETRSSPDRICIASDMHLTAVYDTLLTLSCPLRVCCRTNTQANTDNSLQSESQLSANNWGLDVRANFGFKTPTFNPPG